MFFTGRLVDVKRHRAQFFVRRAAGVAKLNDVPRPDAFRVAALNRQDQQQFCYARSFLLLGKKRGKLLLI
jgi:hypothetical protein